MPLQLRRGRVVEADGPQLLIVELDGGERRPARADTQLVGACEPGDEVIVNTVALDLGLGSGGFDVVHVNLTRGLGLARSGDAHVLKLNYTSLQHPVEPVDGALEPLPPSAAVAVIGLHGQLAPVVWAAAQARPGVRVGYVQTAGGALPASHSHVCAQLLERGLLAGHLSAGPAYGAPGGDALTTVGALAHAFTELGWEAAVCGPGPGIVGSGTELGHGGLVAFDSANAALALGARTVLVARMSEADPRPRHLGLSHHTRTVLTLLARTSVEVALPEGVEVPQDARGPHEWRSAAADVEAYAASGLPAMTMGRVDPLFFRAALAAGAVLVNGR